jgi:CTP synthase
MIGLRSSTVCMEPGAHVIRIALVGKYVELKDAYISINEALASRRYLHHASVEIKRIDSERLRTRAPACCEGAHGILVAPGFGARGVNGKLRAIPLRARAEDSVSWGFATGCSSRASSLRKTSARLPDAMTSEVDETTPDPGDRLHARSAQSGDVRRHDAPGHVQPARARGEPARCAPTARLEISERHRHRYEFNNRYRPIFEEHGMRFSGHHTIGKTHAGRRSSSFRPICTRGSWERKRIPSSSRGPTDPSPLYRDFIGAALAHGGSPAEVRSFGERVES